MKSARTERRLSPELVEGSKPSRSAEKHNSLSVLSSEDIESKIYILRGQKVMADSDLAGLYGVSTKRLNEQVKRNMRRFPADFMFRVTEEENRSITDVCHNLRSQIATSKSGGRRYLPVGRILRFEEKPDKKYGFDTGMG